MGGRTSDDADEGGRSCSAFRGRCDADGDGSTRTTRGRRGIRCGFRRRRDSAPASGCRADRHLHSRVCRNRKGGKQVARGGNGERKGKNKFLEVTKFDRRVVEKCSAVFLFSRPRPPLHFCILLLFLPFYNQERQRSITFGFRSRFFICFRFRSLKRERATVWKKRRRMKEEQKEEREAGPQPLSKLSPS